MAIATSAIGNDVRERIAPAIEAVENGVREGRRVLARGQRAAEDAADVAAVRIRQRPFAAVLAAAVGGTLAGAAIGVIAGYAVRNACASRCS
jgi:hypothetical protein